MFKLPKDGNRTLSELILNDNIMKQIECYAAKHLSKSVMKLFRIRDSDSVRSLCKRSCKQVSGHLQREAN